MIGRRAPGGKGREEDSVVAVCKQGVYEHDQWSDPRPKDLELPDRCALEFDFQYLGYFNLGINIFADQIKNEYSGNSYSLRLDQNNAYLYRIQNGSTSNLGNAQSQLSGKTECRVTLLVDKPAKTLSLLINDRLVNKWEDGRGAFAGKGNGVLFTSRTTAPCGSAAFVFVNGMAPCQTVISKNEERQGGLRAIQQRRRFLRANHEVEDGNWCSKPILARCPYRWTQSKKWP